VAPIFELKRLTLRPVSADDEDFLTAHWSDPQIRHFLFDATPAVADEITKAVMNSVHAFANVGYGVWLIRLARGCRPVGAVGLRPLDSLGLEVFYSLNPGSWGNGYATEAAAGVIDYAFGPLGLTEVFAEIDVGNTASAAVIERLGMTAFATVPGVHGPMIRYRKTRDD
jgi:ribosomal-protein-alanine N-acetyltransferase